jgi:microcystin-dependent protein
MNMSEPFLAEIRIVSFNFAPRGWAFCNGQLIPINQNQALFALLGTTYGGDGRVTFALPDLRGRAPIHAASGFALGQSGGEENHTLTQAELLTHGHMSGTSDQATDMNPASRVLASKPRRGVNVYAGASNLVQLKEDTSSLVGGDQAHVNMQPCLVLNFVIALQGIFPSRN